MSFLILNTINTDLTGPSLRGVGSGEAVIDVSPELSQRPPAGVPSGEKYSHEQAKDTLVDGISIKPGADLSNINKATIDEANILRALVGNDITITEGTGGTHNTDIFYNHRDGYKLDIRSKTSAGHNDLTDYIPTNLMSMTDGHIYFDPA